MEVTIFYAMPLMHNKALLQLQREDENMCGGSPLIDVPTCVKIFNWF